MNTEVVGSFICSGKHMIIVKLEHAAHIMPYNEWKSVYGKLHTDRWKNSRNVRENGKPA